MIYLDKPEAGNTVRRERAAYARVRSRYETLITVSPVTDAALLNVRVTLLLTKTPVSKKFRFWPTEPTFVGQKTHPLEDGRSIFWPSWRFDSFGLLKLIKILGFIALICESINNDVDG